MTVFHIKLQKTAAGPKSPGNLIRAYIKITIFTLELKMLTARNKNKQVLSSSLLQKQVNRQKIVAK